jgi:DNA modification methylase
MQELDQVLLGDCVKIMKSFPSNHIDLVLTDPP